MNAVEDEATHEEDAVMETGDLPCSRRSTAP